MQLDALGGGLSVARGEQAIDTAKPRQHAVAQPLLERSPLGICDTEDPDARGTHLGGSDEHLGLEPRRIERERRSGGGSLDEPRIGQSRRTMHERDLPPPGALARVTGRPSSSGGAAILPVSSTQPTPATA